MHDRQDRRVRATGPSFQSLWGRSPQLIDCQNLFCEVGKYARVAHPDAAGVAGRTRIKQVFKPDETPLPVWFPPKWGLNELPAAQQGFDDAEHRFRSLLPRPQSFSPSGLAKQWAMASTGIG
jgi:hypothetical protein